MKAQRKWLVLAALLLVVGIFPHYGMTEGGISVRAEQEKTSDQSAKDENGEAPNAAAALEAEASSGHEEQQAATEDESEAAAEGESSVTVANTESAATAVESEVKLYPVTATMKIAENDSYTMYMDEKTGNIRLVERKTGTEWLGAPQVPRTTMPNSKKFMDAAVHITYTEGVDTVQTYLAKEKENKLSIEATHDGARVTFQFVKEKLEFVVEYKLTADGFELTVPEASIKEEGTAKFISIEPLPFWNAAAETEEGAIFLPDGAGTLMRYTSNHPQYFAGYSERIYGADPAYVTQSHENIDEVWRQRLAPKEKIALPVFGNYRNGVGSLGIVTQGQYDAKINGTPSGVRAINYYRTSAEFVYRWNDVIFIGTSGEIPFFQGSLIKGDRQLKYVLLQGEQADYVGMAQAYGQYLRTEQNIEPVHTTGVPMQVKLLGGLLRDEVLGETFISMTTFDEARDIIDTLQQKGIEQLELTLAGWSDDGLYGNQPDHFPVEKKLGGAKKLKELAAYAADKGISLYLEANYARVYYESGGMKKSKDAIRGMDREVVPSTDYYIGSRWNRDSRLFYWMKPERVISKHIAHELDDYVSLGISGIHLAYWGDTLYSDLDTKSPYSRRETAAAWMDAISEIRQKVGGASVDYGFAYMLGHIDGIRQAPLDSSHFIYNDETVPFYQIALRGLVPYTASPINLRNDARGELLRMVEYGALPSLELTYEPTTKLQRTMEDRLWSSHYASWADAAAQEYQELAELYAAIENQAIADHEQLSGSVYRTTYENGKRVLVNYGSTPAEVDGMTVQAAGYAMQRGGR